MGEVELIPSYTLGSGCGACCAFARLEQEVRNNLSASLHRPRSSADSLPQLQTLWERAVAPRFVAERAALLGGCRVRNARQRIAVLMSGGARTITTDEAQQDFVAFFRWLQGHDHAESVQLFAYLDLTPRYDVKGLPPGVLSTNRSSAIEIRRAIASFGVEHLLRLHTASGGASRPKNWTASADPYERKAEALPLRADAVATGLSSKFTQQFLKLWAASKLMERFERERSMTFDVVIRIRPDACIMRGLPFFAFALRRTRCESLVTFTQSDVASVAPRPLVSATMAREWRFAFRLAAIVEADVPPDSDTCGGRGLRFGSSALQGVGLRRPQPVGCVEANR